MAPELRRDPIVNRWVIISTDRAKRPMTPWIQPKTAHGAFCPFCEGNESATPPETLSYRPNGSLPDGPGWTLRAVDNKFPALKGKGPVTTQGDDLFQSVTGVGKHEVIIETPLHDEALADLPERRVADLFESARRRIIEYKKDERLLCVQFFKNHGYSAGASLEHSHSQLIAMPVISKQLSEKLAGARRKYDEAGICVYCDIMNRELENKERVIEENRDFVAIAPFAPRFSFETWILPKKHGPSFEMADPETTQTLARMYKSMVMRINSILGRPPYNMTMHTAPFGMENGPSFHWHIEMWPVTGKVAGFEWGSGFHINSMPPEQAAETMRKVKL